MKQYLFYPFLLFLLSITSVSAQETVPDTAHKGVIYCNPLISVREDPEGNLTINDVQSLDFHKPQNILNFGLTSSYYWIKLRVSVPLGYSEKLRLVIINPLLDSCEIFLPDKNTYRTITVGNDYPFSSNDYGFHLYNTALPNTPGEYVCYLRARNNQWMIIPLFIFSETEFNSLKNRTNLIDGIIYGVLLILFIYCLVLAFTTRDKKHYFFLLLVFSSLSYGFISEGHLQEYFFNNSVFPDQICHSVKLFGEDFLLLFCYFFLFSGVKIKPLPARLTKYIGILFGILAVLELFIPEEKDTLINSFTAFVTLFCVIGICICSIKRKNYQVWFILPAFLTSFIGMLIFNFTWSGVLPMNLLTTRIYPVSEILMFSLFAFGLANTVNRINRENIRLAKLEKKYETLKFKVVQERTSPHFLYNALATLNSLMKKDIDKAEEALMSLSEIYHYLTDRASLDTISLKEELDFVTSYLSFEKISYENELTTEIMIEGDLNGIKVPPLCVQQFVRNSIKHGIEKHGGLARISVIVRNTGHHISVEICDNGPGLDDENIHSKTTENIRELLTHHHRAARIDVHNREEGGLRVNIDIPVEA